jgi:hypothetical protein
LAYPPAQMTLLQRAIAGLLLIAAVVALVVVFTTGEGSNEPVTRFPAPVQRIVPQPDQLVVRQARVGIVLDQGYEAELAVDDTPIPKDQLIVNDALGEYFYQPIEGLEIEEFAEGRHCVTATIINRVQRGDDPPPARWCFRVA